MKRLWAAAFAAALALLFPTAGVAGEVIVFAASSLKETLEEAVAAWQAETGNSAIVSLAGSSTLARQIEAGAPADLFLSANVDWVDRLDAEGLLRPGARYDLLTNALVVIAHDPAAEPIDFSNHDGLVPRLGDGRLAMALVDAVPAGIYGKAALQSLGWWAAAEPQVAQADNVRAALALVATGEAPLGIVYATDAAAEPRVTVIGVFPAETHPPIRYPLAVTAASTAPEAEAFADWLAGPVAAGIFRTHGFGLAGEAGE